MSGLMDGPCWACRLCVGFGVVNGTKYLYCKLYLVDDMD